MNDIRCSIFATLTAVAIQLLCAVQQCRGTELDRRFSYVGSYSCNSVACHGDVDKDSMSSGKVRNEFATWMHTDPHARSGSTIQGEQFAMILARLGAVQAGKVNSAVYARCASCHDPMSIEHTTIRDELDFAPLTKLASRGIGCESCHGPASGWQAKHFQRDASREQLINLGMSDTKDLAVRGRLCARCHVGSPDNDMNHDMIAAGHPALRFELVSYHDRLPKHWDDASERLQTPGFASKLWAVGQITAAQAAIELSQARLRRAEAWPELSEYNCFACHKQLRSTVASGRAAPHSARVSPNWGDWQFALIGSLIDELSPMSLEQPSASARVKTIREQIDFSSPSSAVETNDQLESLRNLLIPAMSNSRLERGSGDAKHFSFHRHLSVVRSAAQTVDDWPAACQLFLALRAAARDIRDQVQIASQRGKISDRQRRDLLAECDSDNHTLAQIRQSLIFSKDTESPSTSPLLRIEDIVALLRKLATRLEQRQQFLRAEGPSNSPRPGYVWD